MRFTVNKSPSEALALSNCIILNTKDARSFGKEQIEYAVAASKFIIAIKADELMAAGQAGFSSTHRNWMQTALGDEIDLQPFQPAIYLEQVRLEVDLLAKRHLQSSSPTVTFDTDRMSQTFLTNYARLVVSIGQPLVMEFAGHNLCLRVHSGIRVGGEPLPPSPASAPASSAMANKPAAAYGVVLEKSEVKFSRAPDSAIKLTGGSEINTNAIIQPDFKFEDMGIGGLDKEFWIIFRRAFASRIYPQDLVTKMGIKHVKGLILYGPPGTGKTLMARQIAKMLHAREPKIINGPEILNKYVGQSEENIRALFKDAETEYKAKGDNSQLHIIIFDELDAICKQRGGRNDGTGVGDSVVNQLLAKMDGVEQLNNILVIGMTNRLDMLDEALLRPGRFEVQLEISLPNQEGRAQILKIHTNTMRQNDILAPDVSIDELAGMCKNFTGAEIVGLVNSATSFALNRHIKVGSTVEVSKDASTMKVTREDFIRALGEVHAAYGLDQDEFASCGQEGVVVYSEQIREIISQASLVIKRAATAHGQATLSGILLYGSTGSGKTALAAKLATDSGFPLAKLLSTHTLVGLQEPLKISTITKLFMDAYKSETSLIVVDDIEDLIEYVAIGPRFSSALLQTFRNFFKKCPPEGRRLVIIATTRNKRLMEQLGISQHFRTQLYIPDVCDLTDLSTLVLRNQSLLVEHQQAIIDSVKRIISHGTNFSIPVKILQDLLEVAAQDPLDPVQRFMDEFLVFQTDPKDDNNTSPIFNMADQAF